MNKRLCRALILLSLLLSVPPAAARAESLYVVDQARNTVHRYQEQGNGYLDSGDFITAGLNFPTGIAIAPDGSVYVANAGDNTVHKFNTFGKDLGAVLFSNLNNPTAIAISSNGDIAVANSGSNTALLNGVTLSNGINDPSGLVFDAQGNLYIANRGSNTIRKYSGTTDMGDFATFGLNAPTGLATDASGNLYAANYGDNTVHRFNASGRDLGKVSLANLNGPIALAYSATKGLVVSNKDNGSLSPGIFGFGVVQPYGLAFGPSVPVLTLAGTLMFNELVATAASQNVTFQFRDPTSGATLFTRTASVPASGKFNLLAVPLQNYKIWIKPEHFLAKVVTVTTTATAFNSVAASLDGGDANNDNLVDVTDFGILVGAYGGDSNVPGSGYDVSADYNGDGSVDVTDFGLLVGNYNETGDL